MPLEDYIIAAFCLIDDLYKSIFINKPLRKAGFAPLLNDVELLTILVVGELLGLSDNKKIWLEFKSNYCELFPALSEVSYKIFTKHATNLWYVIRIIHKALMNKIDIDKLFLTDCFPIPICHYARAHRSTLFKDKAGFSYCAAKKERYYGFKALLVTTDTGIPIDWVLGAANIDERELLLHADVPVGSTIIGDKGFIGEEYASDLLFHSGVKMLTQTRSNMLKQNPKPLNKMICKVRKRIETCISQLVETFNIVHTKARSFWGFIGRLNRKILAYTLALHFNYLIVKDQFTKLELLIQA